MYDVEAQKLAIKTIGTVESGLNYRAVNYTDPITIGFMQWFGTRAAGLLGRIRTENAASWVGIPASLTTDLDSHPAADSWWTDRYLTSAEGEPLREVLNNNKAIQNAQAISDLDAYKTTATRQGIDAENNTPAMLFFFVMYHQSPRRALGVIASAGPQSDIDRLYSVCMNEPVLSQYRTRYTTARDIIKSGDNSGIGDVPDPTPVPVPDPGGNPTVTPVSGSIAYIVQVADQLHIHFKSGQILTALPSGPNRFLPSVDGAVVVSVDPLPTDPTAPPTDSATGQKLVDWMMSRLDRYAYSQGASRLAPEQNMYTDCSALVHYCYKEVTGIEIGTNTLTQYVKGADIAHGSGTLDESLLKLGDLIFFDWNGGRVDHVDMYKGNGETVGHGGPGNGPDVKTLAPRIAAATKYWVRRHV